MITYFSFSLYVHTRDITKGISLKVCKNFKHLAIDEIKGIKHFFLSSPYCCSFNQTMFPQSHSHVHFHLLFNDACGELVFIFSSMTLTLFASLDICYSYFIKQAYCHNLLFIGLCSSHISFHSSFELVVMFSHMTICYSRGFDLRITILVVV